MLIRIKLDNIIKDETDILYIDMKTAINSCTMQEQEMTVY